MEEIFGVPIPRTLRELCNPRDMALLVYDVQVGIVRQISDGAKIVARVADALQIARTCHMRVFFTRHMSLPRELMGSFQYRMAMVWQRVDRADLVRPWFLRDSPAFQIVPELTPLPSEAIFDKLTMSAFEGTPLDIALRDCGVTTVVIVGVATEIGIEPTVRHAVDLGYLPVLVTDACGAGNVEAGQRALASLRFMGDAFFTSVEEFSGILARKGGIAT